MNLRLPPSGERWYIEEGHGGSGYGEEEKGRTEKTSGLYLNCKETRHVRFSVSSVQSHKPSQVASARLILMSTVRTSVSVCVD